MDGCDWRCALLIGGGFFILQWGPVITAATLIILLGRKIRPNRSAPIAYALDDKVRVVACVLLTLFIPVWMFLFRIG